MILMKKKVAKKVKRNNEQIETNLDFLGSESEYSAEEEDDEDVEDEDSGSGM